MPSNKHHDEFVRIHGRTTYAATTAVGTTTAGAYVQLTVAANSSAIFGAEIATMSTLFARYKVEKLGIKVATYSKNTNRYWGVKYTAEAAAAPGTVTCLSLMDGPLSDVRVAPEVTQANLVLQAKDLDTSGIEWRETDQTTENLGSYGTLTVINELSSEPVFVTFDWVIVMAGLGSSSLHALPPKALRGLTPKQVNSLARFYESPVALVPLGRNSDHIGLQQAIREDDEWETVSVRRKKVN